MTIKVYQQGQADGLCGLYSAVNFLTRLDDWKSEQPTSAMEYVLAAAQSEGILTPAYLTIGYESFSIKSILNRVFENYLMPYRAVLLKEVGRQAHDDWFLFYQHLVKNGCSIIGGPKGRNHWVLVTCIDNSAVVLNSADHQRPMKKFDRRQSEFCADDGVAILPHGRPLIEIGN